MTVVKETKKTGFWYGRLMVRWGDPRRLKHTAGGSWNGVTGTCSGEGVGFNGHKRRTSITCAGGVQGLHQKFALGKINRKS